MLAIYAVLVVIMQIFRFDLGVCQLIGEPCILDSGGNGKCVHIKKCPKAMELARSKFFPKRHCGFDGIYPIVCCETDKEALKQIIARKKCDEYKRRVAAWHPDFIAPKPSSFRSKDFTDANFIGCIICGENTAPAEFPHMAVLGYGDKSDVNWACGGSLISEDFVLTAAHCINTRLGRVKYVMLGITELSKSINLYNQGFDVNSVYIHPNYTRPNIYHDVGLLKLDHPAVFNYFVKPACLHSLIELPSKDFLATGWGAIENRGEMHNVLQKVTLKHQATDICTQSYDSEEKLMSGVIDEWQMCADGGGTRRNTCQGDSGGPLQIKSHDDSLYEIVGITSFGKNCGLIPGVYTRVSHYVPWVESIVWPDELE